MIERKALQNSAERFVLDYWARSATPKNRRHVTLLDSLLDAILRLDGEALVMHVGDKPYVVSPIGQVDLATRGLTLDAVSGIVNQLFPIEAQRAHVLFRRHGQEICKRSAPRCELCPLRGDCAWYARATSQ